MKLINTDDIKYQMLYKENFLAGTGVEAQAVWKSDIDAMPAVDAVCVVRCKDCSHYRTNNAVGYPHCEILKCFVTERWFCAYGRRKDNE